jgi:acyl-CoA thioester hydrolase
MAEPFVFVDRVRFADLDARGHLNNVAFLQFFEAARLAFIRDLHPEHDPTVPTDEDLIVARTEIDYRAPASFEEEIRTLVVPEDVERNKFTVRFEMRSGGDDRLLAEGSNVVVGYDYEKGEAAEIAEALYEALRARV